MYCLVKLLNGEILSIQVEEDTLVGVIGNIVNREIQEESVDEIYSRIVLHYNGKKVLEEESIKDLVSGADDGVDSDDPIVFEALRISYTEQSLLEAISKKYRKRQTSDRYTIVPFDGYDYDILILEKTADKILYRVESITFGLDHRRRMSELIKNGYYKGTDNDGAKVKSGSLLEIFIDKIWRTRPYYTLPDYSF